MPGEQTSPDAEPMSNEKKIMIIAGEASGDLHASHLVTEISKVLPNARFRGVGGDRMGQAGVSLIFSNHEIAVTGFSEVLAKGFAIVKAFRQVKKTLRLWRPDLLILLDFPDFNLRVGKAAAKLSIPVLYYISPQVWAWRRGRIGQIQKMVEKIMVILPFEASLYGSKGVFVGNPLLDMVKPTLSPQEARKAFEIPDGVPVVSLLPGSRRNEIQQLLPIFVEAAHGIREKIPEVRFLLPLASTIQEKEILKITQEARVPIQLVRERTYDALSVSDFAIVASGTATLETAILGVPMVITYKISKFSWFLAKRLVRVPHIGLINMVAGERIVPERIQDDVTPHVLTQEALDVLQDPEKAHRTTKRLREAVAKLGSPGASERAAQVVLQCMEQSG